MWALFFNLHVFLQQIVWLKLSLFVSSQSTTEKAADTSLQLKTQWEAKNIFHDLFILKLSEKIFENMNEVWLFGYITSHTSGSGVKTTLICMKFGVDQKI